jgi:outer membrane protein OmpA-like peptidoglycan-associated protein
MDAVSRRANRRVIIVIDEDVASKNTAVPNNAIPNTSRVIDTNSGARPLLKEKLLDEIKDSATKVGQNIILRNINFYGGRHAFLPQAYSPLQELLETMQKIPTLEIEIQGHICCIIGEGDGMDIDAGDPYLSVNRARAVYNFLALKGIDKSRMSYKGFGHKYPLIPNERTEEDAITNRRVEIKIIKK